MCNQQQNQQQLQQYNNNQTQLFNLPHLSLSTYMDTSNNFDVNYISSRGESWSFDKIIEEGEYDFLDINAW
jgi:hypothetical protein